MKSLKNCLVLFLVFLLFSVMSCDVSDTALSELIRKSRPRDDIRWNEALIVPTTSSAAEDNGKVDAILLFSVRGLHSYFSKNGEVVGSLKTPTVKNDAAGVGLFTNAFIPTNYDSATFPKVVLQTVSRTPSVKGKFFLLPVNSTDADAALHEIELDVNALPSYDAEYGIKNSSSIDSKNVIYRTKGERDGKVSYTYHIARLTVNEANSSFNFTDFATFDDSGIESEKTFSINRVWESPNLKNAVVMFNEDTDRDYDYTCKYATVNLETGVKETLTTLNKDGRNERNLLFDYFIVYDDRIDNKPVWMGILRSGVIYHSHSTNDDYKTNDSGFSFDRYAPLSSFKLSADDGASEYGCTLFGRYSGTGFIVTRFLKKPNSDNKLVVDYTASDGKEYRNSWTVSNGFATDMRAEDVSVFGYYNGSDTPGYLHTVVVLTVDVGVATYQFNNAIPYDFTTGSPKSYPDEVRLPFRNFSANG